MIVVKICYHQWDFVDTEKGLPVIRCNKCGKKLLFLPLEPNKLFHQNGPRDAWKRIVGENNFRNFSFVLESKAYADALLNAVTLLIGEKYHLTITQANDKSNFARIKSIMKAKI